MLKASRGTPAPTAPSSVHMPAKRARGEDAAAREAAGEFTAAAARARQPDHQAYDQAEHAAGLAGQGAQVGLPIPLFISGPCPSWSIIPYMRMRAPYSKERRATQPL